MKDVSIIQVFLMFLLLFGISVGIFLLIRSIILWYWKIDTIVSNQRQQIMLLQQQNEALKKLSDTIQTTPTSTYTTQRSL